MAVHHGRKVGRTGRYWLIVRLNATKNEDEGPEHALQRLGSLTVE